MTSHALGRRLRLCMAQPGQVNIRIGNTRTTRTSLDAFRGAHAAPERRGQNAGGATVTEESKIEKSDSEYRVVGPPGCGRRVPAHRGRPRPVPAGRHHGGNHHRPREDRGPRPGTPPDPHVGQAFAGHPGTQEAIRVRESRKELLRETPEHQCRRQEIQVHCGPPVVGQVEQQEHRELLRISHAAGREMAYRL